MQELNQKGFYEQFEEQRKMFDSIRRQLLIREQREKDKEKNSLSILEYILLSLRGQ